MTKLQATESTKGCVRKIQLMKYQCMLDAHKKAGAGQIFYVVRTYFARI